MPVKITVIAATLSVLVCLPAQPCAAAAPDRSTEDLWHSYCEKGDQAEIERDYPKAETCFRQAMSTANAFGPNSKQMQTSVARMGTILVLQGRFEQADTYFTQSLTMISQMRKHGEPDPDALVWLDDFGDAYQEMGKKNKAKNMYCLEHCVALRELIAPGKHSKLASACNELASLYIPAKKYAEAEKLIYLQIVCISNKYGAKAQIMTPLTNLSVVQEKQGKFDLAETNMTKAIAQMEIHNMPPQYINECRKDLVRIQTEGMAKAKSGK